ncbi:protein maelstrom homolog isoform X1 [Daphnia pulicaria]|uniref:protein maelstrom homolog isoform X1 n=1 Tax=Daphnia pulicaria TaxID=35523 RepID=UPI001EEB7AED|nr:protein maelstrom homolog isoform X1 [Daphnia pulicaria]
MPPKKKTQKANGFMMFMIEMRPRLESDGHKFPGGLMDVHPVCTPLWNNLTTEQKAVYNQRAKGGPMIKEEKLDTRGVPLAWKEREEQKKIIEKSQVFQKIEDLVAYLHGQGTLVNHYFHLAHFNIAVSTDEGEYPPCEMAIVKFSLADGIASCIHEFVNPGQLRLGYAYEAGLHSEKTHKIPATGFNFFNNNYVAITNSIKRMLKQQDGGYAPLFFVDEDRVKATYILEWLIEKSCELDNGYEKMNPFKTYSLNKLFYELRRYADLDDPRLRFTSTSQVSEYFGNGVFQFSPNMACEWHEDQDNVTYCSLTKVKNYAYTIADMCCEHYDLSLLPNRHVPASIADEHRYVVMPKADKVQDAQQTPVMKEDDEDEEEAIESVPRLPNTFSKVVMKSVGPRVAANFGKPQSVLPGAGRGILAGASPMKLISEPITPGPPSQESAPSTPAGRGRGRGFLLSDD